MVLMFWLVGHCTLFECVQVCLFLFVLNSMGILILSWALWSVPALPLSSTSLSLFLFLSVSSSCPVSLPFPKLRFDWSSLFMFIFVNEEGQHRVNWYFPPTGPWQGWFMLHSFEKVDSHELLKCPPVHSFKECCPMPSQQSHNISSIY